MKRRLLQPPIVDLTQEGTIVIVHIKTTTHKFAHDAMASGQDPVHQPIFGSQAFVDDKLISDLTFGLPVFRLKRGQTPRVKFINRTGFTFNLHWHGLNTTADVDGASTAVVFGLGTEIGPELDVQFRTINNNSTLLWVHVHTMFTEIQFIYQGLNGLVDIIDEASKSVTDEFCYPDNRILLRYQDLDLRPDGTQDPANLLTDENRSCFGVINGISCINWYSSEEVPYVDTLYHKVRRNLVKIDVLNGTNSWRYLYLGVCDEDRKVQPFYLIQSDTGLQNPTPLTMVEIAPASRVAILFDMKKFPNKIAHLFVYNFDLTEVLGAEPAHPDEPNNPALIAPVPDLIQSSNPTSFPTPIPDPDHQNQQEIFTELNYPVVSLIPQDTEELENGGIIPPQISGKPFGIKPFLRIKWCPCKESKPLSLRCTIEKIRKVVFGEENFENLRELLKHPGFEYLPAINYLPLLNPKYFYNLPDFSPGVPTRQFILFGDDNENSDVPQGNPLGSTEYCDGANRVFSDMWNSNELNFEFAVTQYNLNPNNYQPSVLPSCLFRIVKTTMEFSNTAMLSNDTLIVQFFAGPIVYGDKITVPIASVTVVFPETVSIIPLNINQWVDLVHQIFETTVVNLPGGEQSLSQLLNLDWTFYPFKIAALYEKAWYTKSVMMKTTNRTNLFVRLLGRWNLLQFFGKALTGDTVDPMGMKKTSSTSMPGNLDGNIQTIFPKYATSDPETQIPILETDQNAELIIAPLTTFKGFTDGFSNDNLMNFTVTQETSEQWIYHNGDAADAHPLHFHLTSGFVNVSSPYTSPGLVSSDRLYTSYLYSKEVYGIGPQQTISFYLKFVNYNSLETSSSPQVPGLGYMIHCHFAPHVSMNSMMIQYFVRPQP